MSGRPDRTASNPEGHAPQIKSAWNRRDNLPNDRGSGRAGHPPPEYRNKQRIEYDICDKPSDHCAHSCKRAIVISNQRRKRGSGKLERYTQQNHTEINNRLFEHFTARTKSSERRRAE